MLKRLSNDPSLARFSGQFVPLKLVTDGNPQWSRFSRKYPIESRAIPRLYVIRADGEQLYANVGSLPGSKLPQMLMTTLQRAGRILSEKEVLALEQAVAVAKPALEEDQLLAAATALAEASKTVALDKLESFAKPATDATSAYSTLETNLDDRLKKLFSELPESANEQTFQTLVKIAEVNAAYKMFRPMRTKSKELALKLRKNKSISEQIPQADAIAKARAYGHSTNRTIRNRAKGAYKSVIRKYPDSPAARLATTELAKLESGRP